MKCVNPAQPRQEFAQCNFANAREGLWADTAGNLFSTSDGGKRWRKFNWEKWRDAKNAKEAIAFTRRILASNSHTKIK